MELKIAHRVERLAGGRGPAAVTAVANLPPRPLNYQERSLNFPYPLRPVLFEIFGSDLTQLCGMGASVTISLLATVGTDVDAWPTPAHFTSWLSLAPVNQISAGQRKKSKTKCSANLLRKSLVQTAMVLQRTDSYLGENHRRLKSRLGPAIAKVAMARKLAIIIYHILKNGNQAIRYDAEIYQLNQQKRELKNLQKKASRMGYTLTATSL